MDQRPKYEYLSYKLLEKNVGVNFHGFGLDSGFLAMTSKAQATKIKIDKLDFIKI